MGTNKVLLHITNIYQIYHIKIQNTGMRNLICHLDNPKTRHNKLIFLHLNLLGGDRRVSNRKNIQHSY